MRAWSIPRYHHRTVATLFSSYRRVVDRPFDVEACTWDFHNTPYSFRETPLGDYPPTVLPVNTSFVDGFQRSLLEWHMSDDNPLSITSTSTGVGEHGVLAGTCMCASDGAGIHVGGLDLLRPRRYRFFLVVVSQALSRLHRASLF